MKLTKDTMVYPTPVNGGLPLWGKSLSKSLIVYNMIPPGGIRLEDLEEKARIYFESIGDFSPLIGKSRWKWRVRQVLRRAYRSGSVAFGCGPVVVPFQGPVAVA